jgi:hypothetical protein
MKWTAGYVHFYHSRNGDQTKKKKTDFIKITEETGKNMLKEQALIRSHNRKPQDVLRAQNINLYAPAF